MLKKKNSQFWALCILAISRTLRLESFTGAKDKNLGKLWEMVSTLSEQQRHKLNFKESFPTWVYKLITILMLKLVKMYTSIYTLIINISTIYFTKTSLPWQLLQIFNQIIEIVYTKKLKNFESSLYGTRFVSYNWSYCFSSFLAILTFSIWRIKQYLQIIIQIRVLQG